MSKGLVAKVDDDDYEWLIKYHWHAHKSARKDAAYYAARSWEHKGDRKTILMHREISGAAEDEFCDHRNGDTLDNQKGNLRNCSREENARNCRPHGSIPYKGVYRHKNRFRAAITVDRKRKYLGYFSTAELAAEAYNRAAKELHGEFAYQNVIQNDTECLPKDDNAA